MQNNENFHCFWYIGKTGRLDFKVAEFLHLLLNQEDYFVLPSKAIYTGETILVPVDELPRDVQKKFESYLKDKSLQLVLPPEDGMTLSYALDEVKYEFYSTSAGFKRKGETF